MNSRAPYSAPSSGRIEWVDRAKAIGIFLIVLGHANKAQLHQFLYAFHVPLFFFLSGMTFKSGVQSRKFFLGKARTLLLPYAWVMAVSIVLFAVLGPMVSSKLAVEVNAFSISNYIFGALYGNSKSGYLKANESLWFLPCLFSLEALLFLLDRTLLKHHRQRDYLLCILVGCVFLIASTLFYKQVQLPFALETACCMLPFALSGCMLRRFPPTMKLSRPVKLLIAALLIVICYVLGCYCNEQVYTSSGRFGNPFFYLLTAASGTAAVCLLAHAIPSSRLLSYIGRNTLVVVLLNKFPLLFFQVLFPPTIVPLQNNSVPVGLLASAASLAMCLMAGEIIRRVCPCLLGRGQGDRVSQPPIQ